MPIMVLQSIRNAFARMWEAFGCARIIVTGPKPEAARALVGSFAADQAAA